jgi:hypothetical protein
MRPCIWQFACICLLLGTGHTQTRAEEAKPRLVVDEFQEALSRISTTAAVKPPEAIDFPPQEGRFPQADQNDSQTLPRREAFTLTSIGVPTMFTQFCCRRLILSALFSAILCFATSVSYAESVDAEKEYSAEYSKALAEYDFELIARTFLDYMIKNGRDTYGEQHSPLFAATLDRKTGRLFESREDVPYAHVKTKPYAPGYEREVKIRGHDRTYTGANPLFDIPTFELFFAMSRRTGDPRYAEEADKAIKWFLENCHHPVTGFYAWGTHTAWNFHTESFGPGDAHEYNYTWPYWDKVPGSLKRHCYAVWNCQIRDKNTGDFNRHAPVHRCAPAGGWEFTGCGGRFIRDWADYYGQSKDPEMKRAILALLNRWDSQRSPGTKEVYVSQREKQLDSIWGIMNLGCATDCLRAARLVERVDAELAERLRNFADMNIKAHFTQPRQTHRNVFERGLATTWQGKDGSLFGEYLNLQKDAPVDGYDPRIGYPLDTSDGPATDLGMRTPWFVSRMYAFWSDWFDETLDELDLLDTDRYDAERQEMRELIVEIAEIYMSIDPEVQWAVWSGMFGDSIRALRIAHKHTGNPAYLRRANEFARLGVDLLMDPTSPLPKVSSFDNWYEANPHCGFSNAWLAEMIAIDDFLEANPDVPRTHHAAKTSQQKSDPVCNDTNRRWLRGQLDWDCAGDSKLEAIDVSIPYDDQGRTVLAFNSGDRFRNPDGQGIQLVTDKRGELIMTLSDSINRVPVSPAEVAKINGEGSKGFSGRYFETTVAYYAGYKDVVQNITLTLKNTGSTPTNLLVTAVWNDSYQDNGSEAQTVELAAGETKSVAFVAPQYKLVRRLLFTPVDGADGSSIASVRLTRLQGTVMSRELVNPRTK